MIGDFMKRILIAVILIIGIAGGGYQYLQLISVKDVNQHLESQIKDTDSQITQYQEELKALPISKYSSNSELVSAFLTSKDAKLLQITAQDKDADGDYSNIVTVKTIDDVAYFTNTISRIVVTLSYNDFSKAFKYIQSVDAPFSSISFDCNKKIISLYLTPVTIGSSDISNEVTDSPSDLTTTEAAQDQLNTDSDITSSAQESSQFDIQYLGGDE
jgi:hypothetical protein